MSNASSIHRRARVPVAIVAAISLLMTGAGPSVAEPPTPSVGIDETVVIEVALPDRGELDRLVELGADLDQVAVTEDGALVAHAFVTGEDIAALQAEGFQTGQVVWRASDATRVLEESVAQREAAKAEAEAALATLQSEAETLSTDAVVIMRADWFTTGETGQVIYVEARSSAGTDPNVDLEMCWDAGPGTPIDSGGCEDMGRFTDAGQYMYHRDSNSWTDAPPSKVRVTSSEGGEAIADTAEWLPTDEPSPRNDPYDSDFVPGYMNPTEIHAAFDALAEEFPDLVEVIEMPYLTNGYRRQAQANLWGGDPGSSVPGGATNTSRTVVVSSHAWGHEGGNDVTVELIDPAAADSPLAVSVSGSAIVVSLGTDAGAALTSTAADVVAALNADAASSALVYAHLYRGSVGDGIVQPQAATPLSDFLSAPPEISREPFQTYAYKIGKPRNKEKVGVLAYAHEHAREWLNPHIVLEAANRLLRNYEHDGATRRLLNEIDVFIFPEVNPDGSHYSFFDFAFQRKNMTNHCDDPDADPGRRNQWGVDNNRNYDYGSMFDGYSGASTNCRSGTFAGPGELSEPENRNLVWLADSYPSIKFSMNLHSSGNYFMWSPGAYQVPGRIPLERPSVGEEAYFWGASTRILTAIKEWRNLAVTPQRTGPIIDVLYSAAGNSGDRLWYVNGFYAWNFETGSSFIPEWPEAHNAIMEFANGLMELLWVAYDYGKDHKPPVTTLVATDNGDGTTSVTFERTEPVTIFYTLDGGAPDFDSDQVVSAGIRQLDAPLILTEDTRMNWFSVDAAGNIENNYNPSNPGNNYNSRLVSAG
jgi:uncharacterized protein YbjQ (UPF0145 family)